MMKVRKIKHNNIQIIIGMSQSSSKSIEVSFDCEINYVDEFKALNLIKNGISRQSIVV